MRDRRIGEYMPPEFSPRFWKGEDISIAQPAVVTGEGAVVEVIVGRDSLPPINTLSDVQRIPTLIPSAKSRIVQLGFIPLRGVAVDIAAALRTAFMQEGRAPEVFTARVGVRSEGERGIRFEPGDPLFRLFRPGHPMTGDLLTRYVETGEIQPDGKRGRDWDYVMDDPDNPRLRTAIAFRIKQGGRQRVKPGKDPISAKAVLGIREYRDVLANFYEPVPEQDQPILWIGETRKLKLSKRVEAVIDEDVAPNLSAMGHPGKWGTHIDSRLIDAGSDWEIRVEVKSPTTLDRIPNYAVFRFMHVNGRSLRNESGSRVEPTA